MTTHDPGSMIISILVGIAIILVGVGSRAGAETRSERRVGSFFLTVGMAFVVTTMIRGY